jgi:hypothetical protein
MPLLVHGMEITLTENVQPIVSSIGGPLAAGGIQTGVSSVNYSAFDHQSGLTRVEAVLGDSVVGTRDLTPRCSFYDFTVCPNADDGSLPTDTRAVPNGSYRLTVRVHDAAGNVTSVPSPNEIQVQNAAPAETAPGGVTGAAGVATGLRLAASLGNSLGSSLIVPWGRRVTLRGQLTTASAQGVGGAEIDILERTARKGARQRSEGRAHTGPNGDFKHVLLGRRPSRTVKLVHRMLGGGVVESRTLTLRVRATATLRASLHGIKLLYAGRVLSHPLPVTGKRVVLQGKAPGFAWVAFATVRTDRLGRFSGTYRLQARRRGVRLEIRAVVPAERDYPYLKFSGRPVSLRVQ